MEISSRSSGSDSENPDEPVKKKARTEQAPDASAAPKLSNPDPYTALPPPDETTKKKKDFVQLIRKARVEEEEAKAASTAKPENFISFDLTDDEDEGTQADSSRKPSPPSEPQPPLPTGPAPSSLPPRPPTGPRDTRAPNVALEPDRNGPLGSRKRTADDEIKPPDYQIKKTNMKASKGTVSSQWSTKKNEEPCPWATVDHSATRDMAFR
jgi:non-canonical poly(A) RNA polymerase PAPD5/7